jgi:hypothetical protein
MLADQAPVQVWGDRIAGFYRTSDHRARPGDDDVDRHVECYSWGGPAARRRTRVLWLVVLPFLLGNLAGWMCSARTRGSRGRFAFHRASAGLGALALTINAVLVAVTITADVLGYQTVRAGLARHQWWLAPLGWPLVSGHPARQILMGMVIPALAVFALTVLAWRSWRYEAVRPPHREDRPPGRARGSAAAALDGGLRHEDFWDGGRSVRLLTWLHVAAATGFLAVVLSVTARAASGGSSHAIALWWLGAGAGGSALALVVACICLDAADGPADGLAGGPAGSARYSAPALVVLAAAGLASAGLFAWLQPGGFSREADLPGMADVAGWTALAIAATAAAVLTSVLIGVDRDWRETLPGGPAVTLLLAFGLLNAVMLGAQTWVAHLVGSVTTDAGIAAAHEQIYLPYVITSGLPLAVWLIVVAVAVFAGIQSLRWLLASSLPSYVLADYQERTASFMDSLPAPLRHWYQSETASSAHTEEDFQHGKNRRWARRVSRARLLGDVLHDDAWLWWGVVLLQLAAALTAWRLHWQLPAGARNAGIAIAGVLLLAALISFLYAEWNDSAPRRRIAILWDIGTFWPRSYHPFAPPCYAERAVPDLQRRMWWLRDNGGRVVLVCYSQGAMLATAALAQPEHHPEGDRPALVTLGSPVRRIYGWAFPAYVTTGLVVPRASEGGGRVERSRDLYYPTDPSGGPVAPPPGPPRRS